MTEHGAATLELHVQTYPSSSKGPASSRLAPTACLARLTLPLAAIAAQPAGKSCRLSKLQLSLNPQLTAAHAPVTASLQVMRWDVPGYMRHLQQLAQRQQLGRQQQQQQRQQLPALLTSPSPEPNTHHQLLLQPSDGRMASVAAAAAGSVQAPGVVQLLLGDVLIKQQALERLQRQLDLAGQCAEAADSRVAELQTANRWVLFAGNKQSTPCCNQHKLYGRIDRPSKVEMMCNTDGQNPCTLFCVERLVR